MLGGLGRLLRPLGLLGRRSRKVWGVGRGGEMMIDLDRWAF
jgi:hypothetical protein